MNRPIKPQKPTKYSLPPKTTRTVTKVVIVKQGAIKLIDYSDREDEEIDYDLTEDLKYISYKNILSIKQILPEYVNNFTINQVSEGDGYYLYTLIDYIENKSEEDYQKELNVYNNRFETYELEMKQYQLDLIKYNNWKNDIKKEKLKLELSKLS